MATKQKYTAQQANDFLTDLSMGKNCPLTKQECFDIIALSDTEEMEDLSKPYFKFESKGEYTFTILGMATATMQGKEIDVVEFENRVAQKFINGDKLFVGACKKLTVFPCFMKVNYRKDASTSEGDYKVLECKTFASNFAK